MGRASTCTSARIHINTEKFNHRDHLKYLFVLIIVRMFACVSQCFF